MPCSDLFVATIKNFSRQSKTLLSFTDIAIMNVALNRADGHILTFDTEFGKIPGLRMNQLL